MVNLHILRSGELKLISEFIGKRVEHILEKLGVETRTAAAAAVGGAP